MIDIVGSVVIIGGGVGGLATAGALRAGGYDGTITIVEASEFPYDRPPLSKAYLAGVDALADIVLHRPDWYDDHAVRLITRTRATAVLTAERAVALSTGRAVGADRVVLATGGRAARPPIPGVESPRVHTLRDHADADRLRGVLRPGTRLLIVGGGLIGAEVASTAVELGADVTIAEPLERPLEPVVGPVVSSWLHQQHRRRGVTVERTSVLALEDKAEQIWAALAVQEAPRPYDAVLLAVGLRPDTALAQTMGLDVDRGVAVDAGQVTSNPAVLAVGDPTRRRVDDQLRPRAEHWDAAQLDGRRAAATILGTAPPPPSAPWFWTDRHGVHVEAVGHMPAATEQLLRGTPGDGPFSVWGLRNDRVVAAVSVDDSTAVRAARRLIDRDVPVLGAALADPSTDLRKLLRAAAGPRASHPSEE